MVFGIEKVAMHIKNSGEKTKPEEMELPNQEKNRTLHRKE